jgi:hypothetical protein
MDIRSRPPPEDMLRMMRAADVLVFDGDNFETDDSDGICVNFVCALPIVCASVHTISEAAPALLAFKLEDEEAIFLDSWHKLRCGIGIDKLPFKVAADHSGWLPDGVVDITYVLIPRSVCLPSYRGGVLCSASVGIGLSFPRSLIFASILDDAKKITSWHDRIEFQQPRVGCNTDPIPVQPTASPNHPVESPCGHHGNGAQSFSQGMNSSDQAHIETSHEKPTSARDTCLPVAMHFASAQEASLSQSAKVFVSLGTLATLATGAVDDHVHLKRQVIAWGGSHIVACELAAESALFQPAFPETLPWHYFHAQRSKVVGDRVEWQEGVLNGVQYSGLYCH